ncbi:MAG TPA: methyltransferase domain-containing protein, partial [Terriglobia bacterium]|nr:methyltransferase domain-containing protein [Terriglobia bacterium]
MARADLASSISLEHLHRYMYASELVRGKRVLDLAAREGHGAWILAETAKSVTALDTDAVVVQRAAALYNRDNLKFLAASPKQLPIAHEHAFDVIVCFDAIDDGTNPQQFFAEIKRLLVHNGLVFISAPNEDSHENLFRAKPFKSEDLLKLLKPYFQSLQLLKQSIYANSVIRPDAADGNGTEAASHEPQYLLAVASDGPIPSLAVTHYADGLGTLLREKEKALRAVLDMRAYQDETIKRQERQLAERKQTIASLEEAFAWHKSQIESLNKARAYLADEIKALRESLESDRKALEWRKSQVKDLEGVIASKDEALDWLNNLKQTLESQAQTA